MSEHTPGPWFYDYGRASIGCKAGWIVGTAWHDQKSDEPFGDLEADMRLIALAPEMLAMLKAIPNGDEGSNAEDIAELIAKAEAQS